jgi:hypothetical protein
MLIASFVRWKTPPDVVPIEVLVFGSTMLVLIVLLHGAGLDRIVTLYKKRADMMRTRKRHPHFAT